MGSEITAQNAREFLMKAFARAGKEDDHYRTDEERLSYLSRTGVQRFKRKALGFWSAHSVKSLDEVAELLYAINMASSLEEARELIPKIVEANTLDPYGIVCESGISRHVRIEEVKNAHCDVRYRITCR